MDGQVGGWMEGWMGKWEAGGWVNRLANGEMVE